MGQEQVNPAREIRPSGYSRSKRSNSPIRPLKLPDRPGYPSDLNRQAIASTAEHLQPALEEPLFSTAISSEPSFEVLLPAAISPQNLLLVNPRQESKRWEWLVVWLSALCIFGGTGAAAFIWLTGLPPLPNCEDMTPQSAVGVQRLYCAQQIAQSGKVADLLTGITLLKNWSIDQPFYDQAQRSIADWSALLMVNAREQIGASDLRGAIETASQIPVSSPVYEEAQKAIAAWKAQWHQGDVLYARAEEAIKAQNWKEATAQVIEMGFMEHEHWRIEQADALSKKILREKEARQALTQAQKLAKGNAPGKLEAAIALIKDIDPGTAAAPEAKSALNQWSQTVLGWALQQWQQGDTEAAIATAQSVPFDPGLPPEGRDLIRLSQAQQLTAGLGAQPLTQQLWGLLEATAAIRQIAPNSPFYPPAQAQSQLWRNQLQDAMQLQVADVIARLGDYASLQTAIEQAQRITIDRPGRSAAQSLIARWNQDIERLQDQPYLTLAQAMAQSGTREDLQRAIAQAQEIPDSRALWSEAQAQMTQWGTKIEVIEDQPALDQARKLAKQNKLPEAIQAADKIRADRALYEEAQNSIQAWQAQIHKTQMAQDQPILEQANGLAARGRLTMAIDLAAQIAPDRILYGQAQASIKQWLEERNQIWAAESNNPVIEEEVEAGEEAESL